MIDHFISQIFHYFRFLGLFGAFLSMFLENIGIPLPTEIGYIISQDIIFAGKYSYFYVLGILTLGHLTGAMLAYRLGLWGESFVVLRLKKNKKIIEVHKILEKWYARYGNLTVFFARFVGYVRPWSSYIAGFAGVRFWPFVIWTAFGSLIFNIFSLYFSRIFISIWRKYTLFHLYIFVATFLLFFGFILYQVLRGVFKKKRTFKTYNTM